MENATKEMHSPMPILTPNWFSTFKGILSTATVSYGKVQNETIDTKLVLKFPPENVIRDGMNEFHYDSEPDSEQWLSTFVDHIHVDLPTLAETDAAQSVVSPTIDNFLMQLLEIAVKIGSKKSKQTGK